MTNEEVIHEFYKRIPHFLCEQPYGDIGRYLTSYAQDELYFVFDTWYHGFYLVKAKSPKEAINNVNCDKLEYLPKGE